MRYFLFLLLFTNYSFSQSELIRTKVQVINNKTALESSTQIEVDSNRICYVSRNKEGFRISIFQDSIQLTDQIIPFNEIYNFRNKGYSYHCLLRANTFALFVGKYLFLYDLTLTNELKKKCKIKLKSSYELFNKSKNTLYAYTYHPLDRTIKTGELFSYNFISKETKTKSLPIDFPIATTFLPNNYFDPLFSKENQYLISDICHYRIRFYKDNELTDSIVPDDKNLFKPISVKDSMIYRRVQTNHLSLSEVTSNNPNIRKQSGHIWSVFYLNENTVFVRLSQPSKEEGFYLLDHIWKKENGIWLLKSNMEINPYTQTSTNLWPYFSLYNRLLKNNHELCFFHFSECSNIDSTNFVSNNYFNPNSDYSNLCYFLWRFQIK